MSIFTDKAKIYVPKLMQDLQLTRIQACGIFGNIGTETGGLTVLQEISPTVKGSKGGYGWSQWTGVRRRKYETWCKNNYLEPSSDIANYKYLVKETIDDESASLNGLRKTTTLEAATETWMLLNLRPGIQHLANRVAYAKQAYEATKDSKAAELGGAGAVIIGGAAVAAQNPDPSLGIWIIAGAFVLAGLVWFFISQIKNTPDTNYPEVTVTPTKETNNVAKPKTKTNEPV